MDHRRDGPSPVTVAAENIAPEAHTGNTDTALPGHSNKVHNGSAGIYTCDNYKDNDMKALIFHNDHKMDSHGHTCSSYGRRQDQKN